jgi:fimbrial chaperone protein
VRVHLSVDKRSELIAITNNGPTPARFQARGNTWKQNLAGEMQLAPTNDLIFFPSLLEINPGETRRIRIAANVPAAAVERTYRFVVEELPMVGHVGLVQVVTHLSIPVFVQPAQPQPKAHVRAKLHNGEVLISLSNSGNSYFKALSVRLIARSRGGDLVHQQSLQGWYVLALSERTYEINLPPPVCPQIASLHVAVQTEQGNVSHTVEIPQGAFCGR